MTIETIETKIKDVSKMNVYQRLAEVRKVADYIQKKDLRSEEAKKDSNSKGLGYKAVSSALVLLKVNEAINDNGLILTVSIEDQTTTLDEYVNSYAKTVRQYRTDIKTVMTWVNVDAPEDKVSFNWSCSAVNTAAAQSVGVCLTYAEKYFILKTFNIPTDELDPDVIDNNKSDKKEQEEYNKMIAKLVKSINECPDLDTLKVIRETNSNLEKKDVEYTNALALRVKKLKLELPFTNSPELENEDNQVNKRESEVS